MSPQHLDLRCSVVVVLLSILLVLEDLLSLAGELGASPADASHNANSADERANPEQECGGRFLEGGKDLWASCCRGKPWCCCSCCDDTWCCCHGCRIFCAHCRCIVHLAHGSAKEDEANASGQALAKAADRVYAIDNAAEPHASAATGLDEVPANGNQNAAQASGLANLSQGHGPGVLGNVFHELISSWDFLINHCLGLQIEERLELAQHDEGEEQADDTGKHAAAAKRALRVHEVRSWHSGTL